MTVKGSTEVYGIIGNPVAHSLSPDMHNSAFDALDLDKAYVAFPAEDAAKAVEACRALGIRGLSVTIPHKERVLTLIDSVDPLAEKIGAVNTLIIDKDKKIHGLNTDWLGSNRALADELELQGKRVLLLGAGGSARAVGFGLLEAGAEVVLASRTQSRLQSLADSLQCEWCLLDDLATIKADALVNATSVGMMPLENVSLVPPECLANFPVVMDIVYAPLETQLLKDAKEAGCKVINGLAMLLYQGAAQFEAWTGEQAPLDVMRAAIMARLTKE
jgi:shikimate dehydrogenase